MIALNIVVCLKQILDPEIASKDFQIDPATKAPIPGTAKWVVDSYSEYALEVALQVREKYGGKLVVLTLGGNQADEVLRRALALTADEAVRLWDPAWQGADPPAVAHLLALAIERLGGADLVLTGRQAGDIEFGLVGPMLAEELGIRCTSVASRVELHGNTIRVRHETDHGIRISESRLPALITITNDETNVPRLPKVKDVMMATRKPITLLGAGELAPDPVKMAPTLELQELYVPSSEAACEFMEGNDGPAKAMALTAKLLAMKVLT